MKTQLELLQSQYRIYIHKLNSSYNRHKQKEYQDELSRIRKEIEDLESDDRVIDDEERKRQLKFKLNSPPKVQDKYKRDDTRYHPKILNNNVSNRNEYSEEFYNNAARNIPIIPKSNKVPKYLIIFLLLVSFIFICIGLNIDFSNIICIGLFILLFIILPIYIILKNIDSIIYAINGIIKFVLFYGCIFIILIFIYNSLNYVGEQTSVIDNILKPIGLKEYTHKELIERIQIINGGIDSNKIRNVLERTDNNTLKYIRSITVHNSDTVPCSQIAIGCAPTYFINDHIDYGTIDVISGIWYIGSSYNDKQIINNFNMWDRYGNTIPYEIYNNYLIDYNNYNEMIQNKMCSSFEYTLNHEIGHIHGGIIREQTGSSESYADNYANQHTLYKGEC